MENKKQKMIKDMTKHYEGALAFLKNIPDDIFEKDVSSISGNCIHFNDSETYDDARLFLRSLRDAYGHYKLESYYLTYSESLAIRYSFENYGAYAVIYVVQCIDQVLTKISNGRCVIKEETTPSSVAKSVVCNLAKIENG